MMKKLFAALLLVTAVAFGATAVAAGFGFEQAEPAASPAAVLLTLREDAGSYTVRAYDGYVAVFSGDAESPAFQTDVEVANLREHDRALLENGFVTSSYEEMLMLLEDFSN